MLIFVAAAATAITGTSVAVTGAFRTIGATDALDAFLFGSVNVPHYQSDNHCDNGNDKNINGFHRNYLPLRAYSAARFLLVFLIMPAITTPIATTTAKPISAATMFKEAGAVIRVPTTFSLAMKPVTAAAANCFVSNMC